MKVNVSVKKLRALSFKEQNDFLNHSHIVSSEFFQFEG